MGKATLSHLTPEQLQEHKRRLSRERGQRYRERNPERVRENARKRAAAWRERDPLGWRRAQYKFYYGITPEEIAQRTEQQGGVCAICKESPPEGTLLHVDHNHDTGAIRGLLCRGCNTGLGVFKDDPVRLAAAIKYLVK